MRLLITGATGFLGWRSTVLLRETGHDVVAVARPGATRRAHSAGLGAVQLDAGGTEIRELVAGTDAVLHFAGIPDPARARADPVRAIRENAATTANLLDACALHGAGLVYPSTIRASVEPPPDVYALSKRLGETVSRLHSAPAAIVRLTSVFGPGQVAWEGATGAIARFAADALDGRPIVIDGNPERTRDFVFVDDVVPALEAIVRDGLWGETFTLASGRPASLRRAAELVVAAVGGDVPIETPGGTLAPGENESYVGNPGGGRWLPFDVRPLEEAVPVYVDWLRDSAPQSRSRS
jgi:nucleoside-diphosphate-sugar epimerase